MCSFYWTNEWKMEDHGKLSRPCVMPTCALLRCNATASARARAATNVCGPDVQVRGRSDFQHRNRAALACVRHAPPCDDAAHRLQPACRFSCPSSTAPTMQSMILRAHGPRAIHQHRCIHTCGQRTMSSLYPQPGSSRRQWRCRPCVYPRHATTRIIDAQQASRTSRDMRSP